MRLTVSRAAAEERLTSLVNEGYRCLYEIEEDHGRKSSSSQFNPEADVPRYEAAFQQWAVHVRQVLAEIFPTELEWNYFRTQEGRPAISYPGVDQGYANLRDTFKPFIARLQAILVSHLARYTDLPIKERLFVEDIDSFMKVRDINPGLVSGSLNDGYLDLAEDTVQMALEAILEVSFHKKDWGGESSDLYTANMVVNGARRPTAFMLKGNGLKNKVMEVKHCGKNGDQVLRLFQNPADLFVIQFVGTVGETVIHHAHGEIARLKTQGKEAHFLVMDGQDTARVLHAYGKLK